MRNFLIRIAFALLALTAVPAQAALFGYLTNATGIYRINTATGQTTLIYNGAPFDGTQVVAAAAQRSSDGQLFFIQGNTGNNNVYRWDPVNPSTPPVLLGATGAGIPYILRLSQHPATGEIWGMSSTGGNLFKLDQNTGLATNVATLTGWPGSTSGDICFEPTTNRLIAATYAVVNSVGAARIYNVPLGGGAVTTLGEMPGMPASNQSITSMLCDDNGDVYMGGGATTRLYRLPGTNGAVSNGGTVIDVGDMTVFTQDFAAAPAPAPYGTKAFSTEVTAPGQDVTMTLTLKSDFEFPMRGLTVTDNLPAGMVISATPNASTTCGGTVSAPAGGTVVSLTGGTLPAASGATPGQCIITVRVRSNTENNYLNCIEIGGESTILSFNNTAFCDSLVVGTPSLTFTKNSTVVSDPINGTTNPKRIPGAFVDYTLAITNNGPGNIDNNTTVLVDAIPANTSLFVGDIDGAASASTSPVAFLQGSPSSNLTYTFTSLNSTSDDVSFSSDGGATFTYVPVADANGVDTRVTHIRINPKGAMRGSVDSGGGTPNFSLRFRVLVR